ncbi:hypothetical protein [Saccharothrix saharensis]|uniref:hypothetical protein n=1 Tax=Saccharothrix saharensis TaxID=571190 RepID=UPI001150747B|nr:hypothetical protein [Saccharothrix saharensis]
MIALNRNAEPLRHATQHLDPAALDTTLTPYTADQVTARLPDCPPVGHHGIRAVTDHVADNDRMPYPLLARFFHPVFRRGNPDDGAAGIS